MNSQKNLRKSAKNPRHLRERLFPSTIKNTQVEVILVDASDNPIGTMEKMEAHRQGLLHRAFSVFIFNPSGALLLQQRAEGKYHSPGLWTNTCCSHPFPGEDTFAAAHRRLKEELGFTTPLQEIFYFTYRAEFDNGLIEHEYDHVYFGIYKGMIHPDPAEVNDFDYLTPDEVQVAIDNDPATFTPWFLIAFPMLRAWLEKNGSAFFPAK